MRFCEDAFKDLYKPCFVAKAAMAAQRRCSIARRVKATPQRAALISLLVEVNAISVTKRATEAAFRETEHVKMTFETLQAWSRMACCFCQFFLTDLNEGKREFILKSAYDFISLTCCCHLLQWMQNRLNSTGAKKVSLGFFVII